MIVPAARLSLPVLTALLAPAVPHPPGATPDPGTRPGRAERLLRLYDEASALEAARFADAWARSPGSVGYEAVLEHFETRLRDAGFGGLEGLELYELETPLASRSWTGLSASVRLVHADGSERVLHAFDRQDHPDRGLLPVHAPAASLAGRVVFELAEVRPGTILLTHSRVRPDLLRRARQRGAAAVVSASLESYNLETTGEHRDDRAIALRELAPEPALPVFQVSPWAYDEVRRARDPRLRLEADVVRGASTTRTLVAVVRGTDTFARADEAVVLAAHLQGAGATDDAGSASAVLEAARAAARGVRSGELARPARSLVFVLGPEWAQVETWLEFTRRVPVAGIGVAGVGAADSSLWLERLPDPVAWSEAELGPVPASGLAAVARCGLEDLARLTGRYPGGESPFAGGAHHASLLRAGIPAVLLYSPPGLRSRTGLDRADGLDAARLEHAGVAALLTAWHLAAPEEGALARWSRSLEGERKAAGEWATDPGSAARRERWYASAADWLRALVD